MTKPIALNVTYDTIDHELAKAYVNGEYVGRVKLLSRRLRFRCPRSPQNNHVPNLPAHLFLTGAAMRDLINDEAVLTQLTPIVIRNYLRNYDYLRTR